jgi:hypothetical protein
VRETDRAEFFVNNVIKPDTAIIEDTLRTNPIASLLDKVTFDNFNMVTMKQAGNFIIFDDRKSTVSCIDSRNMHNTVFSFWMGEDRGYLYFAHFDERSGKIIFGNDVGDTYIWHTK